MPGRAPASGFRHIYAVSDLHTDYELNLEWVKKLKGDATTPCYMVLAKPVKDGDEEDDDEVELEGTGTLREVEGGIATIDYAMEGSFKVDDLVDMVEEAAGGEGAD